jgi:hypothetical protein
MRMGVYPAAVTGCNRSHVSVADYGDQGQAGDDRAGRDEARSAALGGSRGRQTSVDPVCGMRDVDGEQQIGSVACLGGSTPRADRAHLDDGEEHSGRALPPL